MLTLESIVGEMPKESAETPAEADTAESAEGAAQEE
jgi:hypothetical protein